MDISHSFALSLSSLLRLSASCARYFCLYFFDALSLRLDILCAELLLFSEAKLPPEAELPLEAELSSEL